MASAYHDRFFVFLFLLNTISYTVAELLCHSLLTAVVRGSESRGILTTDKYTFTSDYYERYNSTHYRVCICTKAACLRKCCPLGQVFMNHTCISYDLDINPKVYTEDLKLIPNYKVTNFHRVYGKTCQQVYSLQPELFEEDLNYLIYNGTLVAPFDKMTYSTAQFCFENAVNESHDAPSDGNPQAFVCLDPLPDGNLMYTIAIIISMPFLLATFIVYSLPELRNLHGKNLMSHVASLLTAYIVLTVLHLRGSEISEAACIFCGHLTQYLFLATFFWLNVMCFDIWSTFSGFGKFSGAINEKERKKFVLYSIYAWGCPAIISLVTVSINYVPDLPDFIIRPNIGAERCFFESKLAHLAYFYGPMAVIVVSDITLFALTAIKIFKVRTETKVLSGKESRRNDKTSKQRFILYLKLFLVMGINWATEVISWGIQGPEGLWYITDVMNSLQGLFIFWIFVCNRKIKKVLMSRFFPKWTSRESETNTSSLKISMSGNSSRQTTNTDCFHMSSTGSKGSRKTSKNGMPHNF